MVRGFFSQNPPPLPFKVVHLPPSFVFTKIVECFFWWFRGTYPLRHNRYSLPLFPTIPSFSPLASPILLVTFFQFLQRRSLLKFPVSPPPPFHNPFTFPTFSFFLPLFFWNPQMAGLTSTSPADKFFFPNQQNHTENLSSSAFGHVSRNPLSATSIWKT